MRLLEQRDRWKEIRPAHSDPTQLFATDLLTVRQNEELAAIMMMLACVFPEHFTYLTRNEPATYKPRSGNNFWTGEMHERTALCRASQEDASLREAVDMVIEDRNWETAKHFLQKTEGESKLEDADAATKEQSLRANRH